VSKMVQTRRRARQRGAALLRLPTDVLYKIATHAVLPELVVAAGTNVEARTALRKGTDEAERSRFGGIGLTVREAEHVLRTRFGVLEDSDLVSREAAGMALTTKSNVVGDDVEEGEQPRIHQGMVEALLAYGAEPSVPEDSDFGNTLLHLAPIADDPVALARLLIAAGANIDARSCAPNAAGLSPLTWSLEAEEGAPCYDLAIFLIEQGCDVVQAAADFACQYGGNGSLITRLDRYDRTVENRHLVDLITAALEAAGPERRRAADEAAQRRRAADEAARQYSAVHNTENSEYY
jgi:hypothetical protein